MCNLWLQAWDVRHTDTPLKLCYNNQIWVCPNITSQTSRLRCFSLSLIPSPEQILLNRSCLVGRLQEKGKGKSLCYTSGVERALNEGGLPSPAGRRLTCISRQNLFPSPATPYLVYLSITFSVNLEARDFKNLNLNLNTRIRTSLVVEKKPAFCLVQKAQEQLSVKQY